MELYRVTENQVLLPVSNYRRGDLEVIVMGISNFALPSYFEDIISLASQIPMGLRPNIVHEDNPILPKNYVAFADFLPVIHQKNRRLAQFMDLSYINDVNELDAWRTVPISLSYYLTSFEPKQLKSNMKPLPQKYDLLHQAYPDIFAEMLRQTFILQIKYLNSSLRKIRKGNQAMELSHAIPQAIVHALTAELGDPQHDRYGIAIDFKQGEFIDSVLQQSDFQLQGMEWLVAVESSRPVSSWQYAMTASLNFIKGT